MSADKIRDRPIHYDGQAFIEEIVEVLNKNDVRCYDSTIVQFIKTMSKNEFKEFGITDEG